MDPADVVGFEPVDSEGSSLRVDYAPPLGETMARRVKVFVGNKEYEMDMDQYRRQASQGVAGMSARQLVESAAVQPGALADKRAEAWNAYEQARSSQPNFAPAAPYPYPQPQPQPYPQPAAYEQPATPSPAQYQPQPMPAIMSRPASEPQIDIRQELAVLQQALSDSLYQVNENVLAIGGMLAPQAGSDMAGLFAATPQDPQISVDFQLHEFGTITIPYHDVFVDDINIALAYDTRYKGGQGQYVPARSRADGPPLRLFVRRPDGSIEGPFDCVSFGNTIRFGHIQIVVLMREIPQDGLLAE